MKTHYQNHLEIFFQNPKKHKAIQSNTQLTSLKINIKSTITLAILISTTSILTAYTASAYYVASYVYEENGRLWWPNSLGGSFYPWPNRPTGIAFQLLTPLNQADSQYYLYIIKSGVLIALTLLLWFTLFWKVWKIRKTHSIHK